MSAIQGSRNPDLSPEPVEMLSLPNSNLYLRRMKNGDYESIEEFPAPPPVPPKPPGLSKRSTKTEGYMSNQSQNKMKLSDTEKIIMRYCFYYKAEQLNIRYIL